MRLAHFLCLAIVGVSVAEAAGQSANSLGLQQAVDAALENHPLLRAARLGVEQADRRSEEARAERLPKIRLTETVTRGNNPVFVFGSLLEQGRFGPQNFSLPALNNPASITNIRSEISTSLPLFDGMRTSTRIAQSTIGNDQALQQRQFAEQRVRFELIGNYFGVLVAESAVAVGHEAVRMAEADVKRASDRLDAGLAVESDVLAAQVQFAEFKQQRIQAEGAAATALAVLNISMGTPADSPHTLTARLLKRAFDVATTAALVDRALLHRADYRHTQSGVEFADRRITERRSEYLPELNVFASIGSSGRSLATGSADYSVGAAASFNIFDRGRPARLAQAIIDQRLAGTERDRLADQIRVEVVRAYNAYRAAEEQVEVTEAVLSQAIEALRIIQDRYEAGLTNVTDVLRAEMALFRARMNAIISQHDQYVGYANVLLAIGELNDVKAFEP